MSYNNQTIILSEEIMARINLDCDRLIAHQGQWDKQSLVRGMSGFALDLLEDNSTTSFTLSGPTALECALKLIINSDQGAYEKIFNIKALLEVK